MKRLIALLLCLCLSASLAVAAGAAGYLRTAHAMAHDAGAGRGAAGLMQIVICGETGAETITIGADGQPATPMGGSCTHCADCSLVPVVMLPGFCGATAPQRACAARAVVCDQPAVPHRPVWRPSRGPPSPSPSSSKVLS